MENRKAKAPEQNLGQNHHNEDPGLDELRQSHLMLLALITLVAAETRDEFVKLLRTLAKYPKAAGESQELQGHDRQRVLQIVSDAGKKAISDGEIARVEPERRMEERRKGDRRQQQLNNYGRPWTPEQIETLQTLARRNTPIRRIALKLGRTSTAIQLKAKEIDLPLSLII